MKKKKNINTMKLYKRVSYKNKMDKFVDKYGRALGYQMAPPKRTLEITKESFKEP